MLCGHLDFHIGMHAVIICGEHWKMDFMWTVHSLQDLRGDNQREMASVSRWGVSCWEIFSEGVRLA